MKKKVILSLVGTSLLLVGCSLNKEQSTSTSSEPTQNQETTVDSTINQAETLVKENKFYQAEELLEKEKTKITGKNLQKIDAILTQINVYQKAKKNIIDERYQVAEDNLNKVIEQKNGSAVLKDQASKEKEALSEKIKQSKTSKTSETTETETGQCWNKEKAKALASFMNQWEDEMHQRYYCRSFNEPAASIANRTVNDIISGDITAYVGNSVAHFSTNGAPSTYQVVDFYDGRASFPGDCEGNCGRTIAYLFCYDPNGKPVALVAEHPGEAGKIGFLPTKNQKLQNAFARIAQ